MKKYMDKLSKFLNLSKALLIFLLGLLVIGIICGSIFNLIINKNDQVLVNNYLSDFISSINNNKLSILSCFKDSIIFNYSFILIIWILGISIIGLPIVIFMYFGKSFTLGFTIAAIIKNYGIKGCLMSLGYVFPHCVINIFVFSILTLYAMALSIKMTKCIIKWKTIDFKPIMKKYKYILLICLVIVLMTSIYESFIMPKVLKYILSLIK